MTPQTTLSKKGLAFIKLTRTPLRNQASEFSSCLMSAGSSHFYPEMVFLKKTLSSSLTKPKALFWAFTGAYDEMQLVAQLGVFANRASLFLPLVSPGLRNPFTAL